MNIRKIDKLTDEKWLNLYAASFDHNGHAGRWVYASRQPQPVTERQADAVLMVPLLHAPPEPPRLVLLKEYRVPIADYVYAFPAGLLEPGEGVEAAARREMLEETGLTVARVREVSPLLFSSAGLTDESIRLVFVDVAETPNGAARPDASEEIEVVLLDHAAACRLCDRPDLLIDAKVWTLLYMYRLLGGFL
jgi:ADP-ribose pyrophosphatase